MAEVRRQWFGCMAQRRLSAPAAQMYVSSLQRLSQPLLEQVVNMQDDKVSGHSLVCCCNGRLLGQHSSALCCCVWEL